MILTTVSDAHGAVVRRYSSADDAIPADAATAGAAPSGLPPPVALAATPACTARVAAAPCRAWLPWRRGNAYADGVWAPPGEYAVELEVDGQRYRQPLRIVPIRASPCPRAAYAEQFAQARRIEALRATLAHKAADVTTLLQAHQRAPPAPMPPRRPAGRLRARLTAVSGSVPASNPSNGWWLPPRTLDSLRFLDGALEARCNPRWTAPMPRPRAMP